MQIFGLIGYPLGHSFSKKFFTGKFEKEHIQARYELFPLTNIEQFTELLKRHRFSGLNVTIPYKEQIIPYLDALDDTAEAIGAVNVIKFSTNLNGDVSLTGFNTDAIGFEQSIRPFIQKHHKQALILGTGGASKAIAYTLKKLNITTRYVSRTPPAGALGYEELNDRLIQENRLIVNCTPLGMTPNTDTYPNIPYNALTPQHLLYDVVYTPEETLFLQKGKQQGATTVNGLDMLVGQARAAWKIWNS